MHSIRIYDETRSVSPGATEESRSSLAGGDVQPEIRRAAKLLSISCVYPNPSEPALGLFVQRRLAQLASLADVRVIAPIPFLDYGNPRGRVVAGASRSYPVSRMDGKVEVMHPRWLYPPFGGALNGLCLFACLLWPVVRLRRKFPFQIIDAHFGYPDGIAGALLATVLRKPFMVTLRGSEIMHSGHPFRRLFMGAAIRRAARVFVLSEQLRQLAVRMGASPDRIKLVPNGVDTQVFFPMDRTGCRRKHGIPQDAAVILSAGALIELKGHHRVLEAFHSLCQEMPESRLLIAGGQGRGEQYHEQLRRLVSDLGLSDRVRFLGEVHSSAMAELMSAADVFCLASSREGCPNVVMEALACGCPVVATNVGAVPDLIPDSRYGQIIPANDPVALLGGLRCALEKDWDRALIARWGQSRSWQEVAQEVIAEIQQVIAETARQVPDIAMGGLRK